MNQSTAMSALPMPGMSPEAEQARIRSLRNHKMLATGLLLVAALVFLACAYAQTQSQASWIGFVRAAAEAGMVGGLADWFAVTALFRYPLGLKIPHTAIIRRKKDQVGASLSEFVGKNFLNTELITEKIAQADVAKIASTWLQQEKNAERVSEEIAKIALRTLDEIDAEEAQAMLHQMASARLGALTWAPPLGQRLEQFISSGHADPLIEEFLGWAYERFAENQPILEKINSEKAPTWVPRLLNEFVDQRSQQISRYLQRLLLDFAVQLQSDPDLISKVEAKKSDFLDSDAARDIVASAWEHSARAMQEALADANSPLRTKFTQLALNYGQKLDTDQRERHRLESTILKAAAYLSDNYASDISAIIEETIQRWDADEASYKIELMVGKDLQYIRLNGTIVGALAGLVIYSVAFVFFS